jgi:hypothetical protein
MPLSLVSPSTHHTPRFSFLFWAVSRHDQPSPLFPRDFFYISHVRPVLLPYHCALLRDVLHQCHLSLVSSLDPCNGRCTSWMPRILSFSPHRTCWDWGGHAGTRRRLCWEASSVPRRLVKIFAVPIAIRAGRARTRSQEGPCERGDGSASPCQTKTNTEANARRTRKNTISIRSDRDAHACDTTLADHTSG